jgi:hypothetical protein
MTTEQLITELKAALGEGLRSVVLYGSAAAGDFVEGSSDRNILIVADRLGPAELAALMQPAKRWQAAGNALPQLFTPVELAASADVFPIEFLDIQQSRRVLFGSDPFAELEIDWRHFRLQLERELKTRLHLLRQQYVDSQSLAPRIMELLSASVSTFLVLFRAALRLYDKSATADKKAALLALKSHILFDPQPLLDVLDLKQHPRKLPNRDALALFERYLTSTEEVVAAVDRFIHDSPPS